MGVCKRASVGGAGPRADARASVWVRFGVGLVVGVGVCAYMRAWLCARALVRLGVGLGFGLCGRVCAWAGVGVKFQVFDILKLVFHFF